MMTMTPAKLKTKPPVKRDRIISALRSRIAAGQLPPGAQLPPRTALIKEFEASSITVQNALDQLAEEGFTVGYNGRGTFVADVLPFQRRYALVFPTARPASGFWPEFWTALETEAGRLQREEDIEFPLYFDVRHGDLPEFRRLVDDIRCHRVAGVIYASSLGYLRSTSLVTDSIAPWVACGAGAAADGPVHGEIHFGDFLDAAMDYLRQRGCKRVAIITVERAGFNLCEAAPERAAARDLECKPYFIQRVPLEEPQWAGNLTQLIFRAAPEERPDALIIMNDNLAPAAVAGVFGAGINVMHDVEIVTHCNFPSPSTNALPVKRIGYPAVEFLIRSVDIIDRVNAGEDVRESSRVEAVFEDDLIAQPLHTPAAFS